MPAALYDAIVQILAKTDEDAKVRSVAITQLATSKSAQVSETLRTIAVDAKRSPVERQLAAKATAQVALSSANAEGTFVFLASAPDSVSLESAETGGGVFSFALVKALLGAASTGSSGQITADGLTFYLSQQVAALTGGRQRPAVQLEGSRDTQLFPGGGANSQVTALVIGVSQYNDPALNLRYAASDAASIAKVLRERGANVRLLTNPTRASVMEALAGASRATPAGSLLVYFSGHSDVSPDAQTAGWLVADSTHEESTTWITFSEIRAAMERSPAKTRWLFVDSSTAGAVRVR